MTDQAPISPASGTAIAKGAAWLMAFKLIDRGIGLVSTLILARLLAPKDFGLVAMATAVVALLELMGAFGFDSALIQRQKTERAHYDTAWTFNVVFGVLVAAFLVALARPAAGFYREPRLELILPVLALAALIGGLENIGTVAFRKELDFRSEFRFLLIKRVVTFVVTIGLAVTLRTYWALIAGVVTSKLASTLISYRLHPYRPRLTLSARGDLLHFSKWIFISNLILFLHSRSTDFILGRTIGTHGLGVYNVGVELANMPSTEMIAPLNRAVYPAYSRLAASREQLWARFMEVFGIICLLALPVSVGLFCLAGPVVQILLGSQWLEAIPIVRIFALCGLVGALQSNLYLVIVALGKPKANTLLSAVLLVVSLPAVVIASLKYGVVGAAYAHFGASVLGFAGIVVVFSQTTGIAARTLAGTLWRPVTGSSIMAIAIYGVAQGLDASASGMPVLSKLMVLLVTGALSYVTTMLLLWTLSDRPTGPERTILTAVVAKFRGRHHVRFS